MYMQQQQQQLQLQQGAAIACGNKTRLWRADGDADEDDDADMTTTRSKRMPASVRHAPSLPALAAAACHNCVPHVIVNILQSLPAQTNKYASVAGGHRVGAWGQQRDTDTAYSSCSYSAGYGYATWKPNMASILIRIRLWLFVPLDLHCAAGGANNAAPSTPPTPHSKPHPATWPRPHAPASTSA